MLKRMMPPNVLKHCLESSMSEEEQLQDQVERFNKTEGDKTSYQCNMCHNKGWIGVIEDGMFKVAQCICQSKRQTVKTMKDSGLKNTQKLTFDTFKAYNRYTQLMLETTKEFLNKYPQKWLYMGGQSGAGKTHICTAAMNNLLERGIEGYYMSWIADVRKLKNAMMNGENNLYPQMIDKLKKIPVLYIDDFFKNKPSEYDLGIAMEILNYRYQSELVTIISSELYLEELKKVDQALMGRIYEKALAVSIDRKDDRNYRTKGA